MCVLYSLLSILTLILFKYFEKILIGSKSSNLWLVFRRLTHEYHEFILYPWLITDIQAILSHSFVDLRNCYEQMFGPQSKLNNFTCNKRKNKRDSNISFSLGNRIYHSISPTLHYLSRKICLQSEKMLYD